MIKRILTALIVLALVFGGTVLALDLIYSKQSDSDREQTVDFNAGGSNKKVIVEIKDPTNPNQIIREWEGEDGLKYRLEAVRNDNGTYTGSIMGLDPIDSFIEYNFKFEEMDQRGFENLFNK